MRLRHFLLHLIVFLFCGCATQQLPPLVELDQDLSPKEASRFRDSLRYDASLDPIKLLSVIRLTRGEEKRRFRLAISRVQGANRRVPTFRIQVLPTTSLTILEDFIVEGDEIRSGSAGTSKDKISAKDLLMVLGDVLKGEEVFALMIGRIPMGALFSEMSTHSFRLSSDQQSVGIRGEKLEFTADVSKLNNALRLSELRLRDSFRGKVILNANYEGVISLSGRSYPKKISMQLLKRDIELEIQLQKLTLPIR